MDLKFISGKLSCLFWPNCPLKSLSSNFNPKSLVDLDIHYSHIQHLWKGTTRSSLNPSILPYFWHFLESPWRELEILPSNIVLLKSLKFHNLSSCSKLEAFPETVWNMEGLRELRLDETSVRELRPSISCLGTNIYTYTPSSILTWNHQNHSVLASTTLALVGTRDVLPKRKMKSLRLLFIPCLVVCQTSKIFFLQKKLKDQTR